MGVISICVFMSLNYLDFFHVSLDFSLIFLAKINKKNRHLNAFFCFYARVTKPALNACAET